MRVYISGPITGYAEHNEPAFRAAADYVTRQGDVPLVPLDIAVPDHDGLCPRSYGIGENGHSSACHLRADLLALLGCDAILMIDGWEASVGARKELDVAAAVGMPVRFLAAELSAVPS